MVGTIPTAPSATGASPKITAGNAPATASDAYGAASALYASGTTSANVLKGAAGDTPGARLNLAEFATRRLAALASSDDGSPATKAITSSGEACPGGGVLSVSVDDADASNGLSTGDSGSMTFVDCLFAGVSVNGRFSFGQVVVTGAAGAPSRSIGATFTFEGFRAASLSGATAVDGDMSVQAAVTQVAPIVLDMTVSGSRLSVTENAETGTLASYAARIVVDDTAGSYAYSVTGVVTGPGLPDALTLSTPTALTGRVGTFPSAGQLVATASDGSAVRITATSPTSVTVEIDGNGDGGFESSQPLTWAQLVAA